MTSYKFGAYIKPYVATETPICNHQADWAMLIVHVLERFVSIWWVVTQR